MKPTGTITQMFENNDKYDEYLISKCLMFVMDSNTSTVLQWHSKEYPERRVSSDNFTQHIFSMVQAIVKAKYQMTLYKEQKKKALKEIRKKIKNETPVINQGFDRKELVSHFDAFLTQLKTSLDCYCKAINAVHGTNIHGWHKKKNEKGELLSGQRVLNSLEGLPKTYIKHVETLLEYLRTEQNNIHRIVNLRDSSVHPEKWGDITPYVYDVKTKEYNPPLLITKDGNFELEALMENILDYFCGFTRNSILALISDLAPFTQPRVDINTDENIWIATD